MWLEVSRRAPVGCAMERGGDPPTGDPAEPPIPLRAWDSRWDLGSLGEGHGGIRDRGYQSLGPCSPDSEPQSLAPKHPHPPPFLPARPAFILVDGQAAARSGAGLSENLS